MYIYIYACACAWGWSGRTYTISQAMSSVRYGIPFPQHKILLPKGGRHSTCGRVCSAVSPSSGTRVPLTMGTLAETAASSTKVAAEPRCTRLRRIAAHFISHALLHVSLVRGVNCGFVRYLLVCFRLAFLSCVSHCLCHSFRSVLILIRREFAPPVIDTISCMHRGSHLLE